MDRALIPDSMVDVIPGSSDADGAVQMVDHTAFLPAFPVIQRTLQSDVCQVSSVKCRKVCHRRSSRERYYSEEML